MLLKSSIAISAIVGLSTLSPSQSPTLVMPGSSSISSTGAALNFSLFGQPGAPYAIFVDIAGGPVDVLGERFYLGFTGSLAAVQTAVLSPAGQGSHAAALPVFPGLSGLVIYGQAVALNAAAPNGLFQTSNGASTGFFGGSSQILQTFNMPLSNNYTGTFVQDIAGHVRGGAVVTRTVTTVDPQGIPYNQPIASPLVPLGCREQVVYRASNLGATGEPEQITGVRWRSLTPLQQDYFPQFTMRMGHTDVVPDYSIDPWSSLPLFPDSGLSATFADNELQGDAPTVVYTGDYPINPANAQPNNFLAYPMSSTFAYDGHSSLLIDFRVPQSSALGLNGMAVNLMVQSSPLPGTRVVAGGTAGQPVNPNQVASGIVDNAMPEMEIDFARTATFLASPWLDSGSTQPDYDAAIIASSLPAGTSLEVVYRGASTAAGGNPTSWSSSPDVADGQQFLQYRITFHANHITGERPLVDTLVVPIL